jgi:MFS family permease
VTAVVGQQVQSVAVGWEIYNRTGSELSLGWVGLAQALPVMVLALPGGHLADRFDRRAVMAAGLLASALCSLALALLARAGAPVGWMYAVLATAGAAQALWNPARSSLMPQIVPPDAFTNAVAWNSSIFHVASVAGPAIGGQILLAGTPAAFVADAACALVFLGGVASLRLRPIPRSNEPATLSTLFAGVRFIFRTKIILATITLDLFAVLLGGAVFLLPVFAKDILHVGPVGFGWLRAAPAIGALVAGVVIAHRPPMRRAGAAMLWAVAAFGAVTIVFGLSRSFWLSLAALALAGAFDMVSVVVRHTLIQLLPPDTMRGRVAAVNNVFISASNELGGFESGVTAAWWGPVWSVFVGGVGTLAVVAAVALKWPQVRRLGSLQDVRPMDAEPPGFPVQVAQGG